MSPNQPPPEPPDNRRADERRMAVFPAHIERDHGASRSAIIRDISNSGVRLLTRASLEIGEELKMSLYIRRDDASPVLVTGKVVRSVPIELKRADVWRFEAAVHFDEPLTGLDDELNELAARQASLYGER